jgi:hypothetical protein
MTKADAIQKLLASWQTDDVFRTHRVTQPGSPDRWRILQAQPVVYGVYQQVQRDNDQGR